MHDALREVISLCLDETDSAAVKTASMLAEVPQLPRTGDSCSTPGPQQQGTGPNFECAGRQPSTVGSKAARSVVQATAAHEPGGDGVAGALPLEKLSDLPHAAAFVEYVFERMIFGLMQEVVAPAELQTEGG